MPVEVELNDKEPSEPLVLGKTLVDILTELIDVLNVCVRVCFELLVLFYCLVFCIF